MRSASGGISGEASIGWPAAIHAEIPPSSVCTLETPDSSRSIAPSRATSGSSVTRIIVDVPLSRAAAGSLGRMLQWLPGMCPFRKLALERRSKIALCPSWTARFTWSGEIVSILGNVGRSRAGPRNPEWMPCSSTYTLHPSCFSQLATTGARTPSASISTMRALRTAIH